MDLDDNPEIAKVVDHHRHHGLGNCGAFTTEPEPADESSIVDWLAIQPKGDYLAQDTTAEAPAEFIPLAGGVKFCYCFHRFLSALSVFRLRATQTGGAVLFSDHTRINSATDTHYDQHAQVRTTLGHSERQEGCGLPLKPMKFPESVYPSGNDLAAGNAISVGRKNLVTKLVEELIFVRPDHEIHPDLALWRMCSNPASATLLLCGVHMQHEDYAVGSE